MWKIFAIFCVLLPGGECEKKYEFPDVAYKTMEECQAKATIKADQMIEHMNLTNAQMSFNIGCEKQAEKDLGKEQGKDGQTDYYYNYSEQPFDSA